MLTITDIQQKLFSIKTENDFNELAVFVFQYQYNHNSVYKKYVNALSLNPNNISHFSQIPCLPISFFKSQQIITEWQIQTSIASVSENVITFTSSGTTGQTASKHIVSDIELYKTSFNKGFELFYGTPKDYCILALLPNYLQRTGSSLVYMFDDLIKQSQHSLSGFYLNNLNELKETIQKLKMEGTKTLLLGVTYALLDLAETNIELNENFIVMETGGMKGNRPELLKEELHQLLKKQFKISAIHSEYGMTELLSQAYSKQNGIFECPPWMRVLVRDINDPFTYKKNNKTGGINIIDLANINSCSFIETQDLGRLTPYNTFEIMGRFDNSDIRGCNLLVS